MWTRIYLESKQVNSLNLIIQPSSIQKSSNLLKEAEVVVVDVAEEEVVALVLVQEELQHQKVQGPMLRPSHIRLVGRLIQPPKTAIMGQSSRLQPPPIVLRPAAVQPPDPTFPTVMAMEDLATSITSRSSYSMTTLSITTTSTIIRIVITTRNGAGTRCSYPYCLCF